MSDHTTEPTPTKYCPACEKNKPATNEYFSRSKDRKDGLDAYCKMCNRQYRIANKERLTQYFREHYEANKHLRQLPEYKERMAQTKRRYRAKNKEKIAESERRYREENKERVAENSRRYREKNKDRVKEWGQRWQERNREYQSEKRRRYSAENKEKISEKNRRWGQENKDARRAKDTRRRARKLAAEGNHTAADVRQQYKNQRGKCYYCKKKVGDDYHVDHVIPLSRGGSNGPENLVIACEFCNQSKKDKLPHEWPQGGRLL